jgi:hypothetical protein
MPACAYLIIVTKPDGPLALKRNRFQIFKTVSIGCFKERQHAKSVARRVFALDAPGRKAPASD